MQIFAVVGQIIFGAYWIISGINHFKHAEGFSSYAASKKVPAPKVAVLGSGVLLLIGGLGIILGVQVWWAILALIVFVIPVSFTMHAFWNDTDATMKMNNRINFMKNMALLGALLLMWALPMLAYKLM